MPEPLPVTPLGLAGPKTVPAAIPGLPSIRTTQTDACVLPSSAVALWEALVCFGPPWRRNFCLYGYLAAVPGLYRVPYPYAHT